MHNNHDYPAGADDKRAPWNQEEPSHKFFTVTISQTLSRTTKISTNDYSYVQCIEPYNKDQEVEIDTDNTDWKTAYENWDFKIQDLIAELKDYVQADMQVTSPNSGKGVFLQRLLEACEGWVEDDYEVCEG